MRSELARRQAKTFCFGEISTFTRHLQNTSLDTRKPDYKCTHQTQRFLSGAQYIEATIKATGNMAMRTYSAFYSNEHPLTASIELDMSQGTLEDLNIRTTPFAADPRLTL